MKNSYIAHHGVPGQKHGVRLYQYKDGSLTPLGRIHYGVGKKRTNEDGSLTENGRKLYYTNGYHLSRAGKRAVDKAQNGVKRIFSKKIEFRKEYADKLETTTAQLRNAKRSLRAAILKSCKAYGIHESHAEYFFESDPAETLDLIRHAGGNRQVERALKSYNAAARASQKALREVTDSILSDLGETRKHDLKLDGAALSYYESRVRSMLLYPIPYPLEIS